VLVKEFELVLINHIDIVRQAFNGAIGHEKIKSLDRMFFSYFDIDHG
jgi:hypothetical protein